MASLDNLARLYQKKKESIELETKMQKSLKSANSVEKRLHSRIMLLEKKIDMEGEHADDLSAAILRRMSQMDSLGRLVDIAKRRLSAEQDEIAGIQQNPESSKDSAAAGMQDSSDRLERLAGHVEDLASEIAGREKTAEKATKEITQYTLAKSKSASKIQKHENMKATLEKEMADARVTAKKIFRDMERQARAVASAERVLAKEEQRLQNILNKKPAKKPKTASAKKPAKKPAKPKPAKKPKTASAKKPAKKPAKPKPAKKSSKKQQKSKNTPKPVKKLPKNASKPVSGKKKK